MLLGPMLGAMQHVSVLRTYNNWPFRGERRRLFFDQVLQATAVLKNPFSHSNFKSDWQGMSYGPCPAIYCRIKTVISGIFSAISDYVSII